MKKVAGPFPSKDLKDYITAYEALSQNPALRYGYDDTKEDFPADASNWVRKLYGNWETHIIVCGSRLVLYALESKVCPTPEVKAFSRVSKLLTKSQRAPNKPYAWWLQHKEDLACLLDLERWKDKSEAEGTGLIETVSGFKLINEAPQLSAKGYDQVREDFTKAVQLIERSGVDHAGNLAYGNCIIVPEIERANVLAFYRIKDDSLYIKAKTKDRADLIQTVIHEIGHRLWYRFTSEKQRADWREWHKQCVYAQVEISIPTVGEELRMPIKGHETFPVVTKIMANKYFLNGSDTTYLRRESISEYFRALARFPSQYASVSPEENFAESFAFFCLGSLNEAHRANFEKIFVR